MTGAESNLPLPPLADREVELVPLAELRPSRHNARKHSRRQVELLKASIRELGWTVPILIDEAGMVLAGHARLEAGKGLGLERVPCIRLGHLSEPQKRALMLADNQIAAKATWDLDMVAIELKDLISLDVDVSSMGFEIAEADVIIAKYDQADPKSTVDKDDECPAVGAGQPVCRRGDVWRMGNHRLVCGDARSSEDVARLMAGEIADACLIDPPYNVKIDGNVAGHGKVKHREFVEASGEMSGDEFVAFLVSSFAVLAAACRDGAIAFVFMDWRHMSEMLEAGHRAFDELMQLCVWNKTNGGLGSFYRSQHELVFVWKVGTAPHRNTFGLGGKGRYRTNVWSYPGANGFSKERMDELVLHPTVKNAAMVGDAIKDVTKRGEIVLDTSGGSGTTLIAAERSGRFARIM